MKRLLLAALAGLALTTIANAADLGVPIAPVGSPVIVPPGYFEWFGPYVGVFGGGGFENSTRTDYTYTSSPFTAPHLQPGFEDVFGPTGSIVTGAAGPLNVGGGSAVSSALAQGFLPSAIGGNRAVFGTAGAQIGFNIQMAHLVFGLDGDWGWMNGGKTASFQRTIAVNNQLLTLVSNSGSQSAGLHWLGTLRGRAGYAFDRVLIFLTGGWAVGGASASTSMALTETFLGTATSDFFSGRGERFPMGVAVGAGIEWALTNYLTVKGEGLFYDLGTVNYPLLPAVPPAGIGQRLTITAHQKFDGAVFRIGLNYKPDWL